MLKKTYLLFWKNVVLLRRHYIVTAAEIILPIVFAIVVAAIKAKELPPFNPGGDPGGDNIYEELNSTQIAQYLTSAFKPYGEGKVTLIMGYTPRSSAGEKIIEEMIKEMNVLDPAMSESNYTDRVTVNITAFDSEEAMVAANNQNLMEEYFGNRSGTPPPTILFGLVLNGVNLDDDGEIKIESNVSYKIRVNDRYSSMDTSNLFPSETIIGPGWSGNSYFYGSRFVGIQFMLDTVLIKQLTKQSSIPYSVTTQRFPYPQYVDGDDILLIFLPIFTIVGFIFIIPQIVRGVVSEKETGIKELMKMSGLPEWMHWFGWMLNSILTLVITVTVIVIIFFIPFGGAGAVYKHSDFVLFWILMMVFVIWATTFCFMISAFFEKPALATTVGMLIYIVSYFGLGLAMERSYGKNFSRGLKLLFCLFPNVGMHFALVAFSNFEVTEIGAKWSNLTEIAPERKGVELLYAILMMLASACLNMIVCLYAESVMPKKHGVRKPFYFLFMPSYWEFGRSTGGKLSANQGYIGRQAQGFEDDPKNVKAGVEIRALRKEFGKRKVAVNDLSVNIFEGQIFCLLGQNGAGKTTTMSILTGLLAPTTGTALIDGYDIQTDMDKIRQSLGLCPQHNMFFDYMTVLEHLKFFGVLKGLSFKDAAKEGKDLLSLLQMEEKKNALSMNLSGGQKRRLSLGCALIGGSKVIFLDEPTSGMDPEARRAIWDILLKIRGERTIVLTTHFMEEADVLGDRIAILTTGALQCCGTPNYLKRFYGAGYTLNMTIAEGADRDKILQTVCQHIPGSHFKKTLSNSLTEVGMVIPSDSHTSAKFPALFSALENTKQELKIDEVGIGWTTMDEVFVRVEELSHNKELHSGSNNNNEIDADDKYQPLGSSDKVRGGRLIGSQFAGLLLKNLFFTMRQKRLLITQIVIPILITIAAINIGRTVFNNEEKSKPALDISLSSYSNPITLYASAPETPELGQAFAKVVGPSAQQSLTGNTSTGLLNVAKEDINKYRQRYIVAAELNATHMKAMYSNLPYHAVPLSFNLITNTILEVLAPEMGYRVHVANHPFPDEAGEIIGFIREVYIDDAFVISFAILVPIGMSLLLASFVIGPIEERLSKGKHLQMMTGVHPFLFWCSYYICDFLLAVLTICLITACLPIFETNKMFTNHDGAGIFLLILLMYVSAAISFSYIFSTFVRSVAGGFSLVAIVHVFAGVGLGMGSYVMENFSDTPTSSFSVFVTIIGRIFPTYGVTKASVNFAITSSQNSFCHTVSERALDFVCNTTINLDNFGYIRARECCENCAELGQCFKPEPYFQWTKKIQKGYDKDTLEPIIYNVPALNHDLLWLGVFAVVNFAILMLIEYDVFMLIREKLFKEKESDFNLNVSDTDVLEENSRVKKLVTTSQTAEDAFVVDSFCKSYGSFAAVSKLSFGVHHGECFGLLGVNGAGKTTTFRMLTGDETRSSGSAFLDNLTLSNGRKEFLSKLGYCPQFDGIIGVLTGKEMLKLFGRLRGVFRVEEEANKWLYRTGLSASANVQCKNYSGGMKRRLSAAMALIGDPPVILLDEPTSGVDPVARRQFWKIISSVKNSGQAIILTSHSMEECETLCARLGIMVNGEMQCMGGVQHLKNKFAQGYSLTVKLKDDIVPDTNLIASIIASIQQAFESCTLKDHHLTTMKFEIHAAANPWQDLYSKMENIKQDFAASIEEYAITETTLEEVFLSFARKQYVNERATKGNNFFTKLYSCDFSRKNS